jgi:hypothetical protein
VQRHRQAGFGEYLLSGYFFFSGDVLEDLSFSFLKSPIILLSGHILKRKHFLQPVRIAIGQSVMANPPFF